jgi:DNA-binding Lrp family transcriptional regulator
MTSKVDKYDKHLIYELDRNCRAPISTIAKKVGLPKETVNYRLKKLISSKYIKDFHTIINVSIFGYRYYKISLKFHRMPLEKQREIVEYVKKINTCANITVKEGRYDLSFIAIHRTARGLYAFLQDLSNRYGRYIVEKNIHKIIRSYKMNQKILYAGDKDKKIFEHAEGIPEEFTEIDKKIIKSLSHSARNKLIDLANQIKEDPRVVAYHIKKLEEKGVIVAYTAGLNFEKFELEFIEIEINLKHHGLIPKIIDFFDETNTCIFAYEFIGTTDLSLQLYVQSDEHMRKILSIFKERFGEDYNSYEVSRIYETYQTNWSPFEE